jgi:hypothetical protein
MRPSRFLLIAIAMMALLALLIPARKSSEANRRIDADLEKLCGVQNLVVTRSANGYAGTGTDAQGRRIQFDARERDEKLIWRTFITGTDGRTHETGGGVAPLSDSSSPK